MKHLRPKRTPTPSRSTTASAAPANRNAAHTKKVEALNRERASAAKASPEQSDARDEEVEKYRCEARE
jgi:anti-sigma28 factor (negative regulator of flagellin synthesis)